MIKENKQCFVLTLPLVTTISDNSALDKYMELSRKLYNSLLGEALRRFNLMRESKLYQKARKETDKKLRQNLFKDAETKYEFDNFSLNKYSTTLRVNEFKGIDANTVQALSARAYDSVNKMRFGKATKVNFIRYGEMHSFEGLSNRQGIRFRDNIIYFNKLKLSVKIKPDDIYAQMALKNKIKYCRIKRTMIKGNWRYYVQLILDGVPPTKIDRETGEFKHYIDNTNSKVGIDIGTQTVAYCSDREVGLLELAPEVNNIEKQKRVLSRKLDRSRRSMNPNKYNENGTIIKGNKEKWIKSNRYLKTQNDLRELQRKNVEIRKQSHNKLANHLLTIGTDIKVEQMNYKRLQKKAKKTTTNEKTGKTNKKKRFGKSLANKAPSMLLTILDNKLKWLDKRLSKINTAKIKASQYNHISDAYVKKKLSERWNDFIEFKIQRDLYSAFLIMNVKDNLNEIDRNDCFEKFDSFRELHDKEVIRIKNCDSKLISSMGI